MPVNDKEEIIDRKVFHIRVALLKNKLHHNIILYRKDINPSDVQQMTGKFISTLVTTKGVFKQDPNTVIIVPKNSNGAYIERLSDERYKHQREFLLGNNVKLEQLIRLDGVSYYKAVDKDG